MNQIVKYEPAAPMNHESWLMAWVRGEEPSSKSLRASLNRAWPGDLDTLRRDNKTIQLIDQAMIHISSSEGNSAIRKCCNASVFDSLVACASFDLNLQKAFGEAYLVPYAGVCTLMVGYRGFIKLLVNTGSITQVESVLVYEGEKFDFWRDETGPHWLHKPDVTLSGKSESVVGCYAVGYTRNGPPIFEFMNLDELTQVKGASAAVRSGKKGPYTYWATEMMRKAPIRRMQKYMPKVADNLGYEILSRAVEHDNQIYDLKGYQEMTKQMTADKTAEREATFKDMASEPAVDLPAPPNADDKSTWPLTEDGEPIPPELW